MIDAEAEYLLMTEEYGRHLLAEVRGVRNVSPGLVMRWRRHFPEEVVAAALRIAEGRRKARAKFSRADAMWLTPTGAEQATGEVVARHKAARFAASEVEGVVDLCCGIGGDAMGLAGAGVRVLGVDRDRGMCRRVAWNSEVHGVENRVWPVQARAEQFAIPVGWMVHVDPDRRTLARGRARRLADYVPSFKDLERLMRRVRGGAIKLGPASDFERLSGLGVSEVELVSLDGECKEATLWFGELAGPETRRATTLPSGATWAATPTTGATCRVADHVGPWLFDTDPALARSGLIDHFASAHDLARVDSGVDYLTAAELIESPFLRSFAVEAVLPPHRKQIREYFRAHRLQASEVKLRGVDPSPEEVRGWIDAPPESRTVTLLLFRGPRGSGAVVARRWTP